MIEEPAVVCGVGEGFVWVERHRQATCHVCSANGGCGNAILAKALGRRRMRMRVSARIPLQVGDEVAVGIGEHDLLSGSLAMYIVPLFGLFLGAIFVDWVASENEMLVILGGVTGLSAGFASVWSVIRRSGCGVRFQPVVLRRLVSTNTMPNEL